MNQSPQLDQLFTALAKAQGEMTGAAKDCANPFFKSRYADLSSIWTACREPLSKYGLTVLQGPYEQDGRMYIETMLGHSSGQFVRSYLPINVKIEGKGANELQALGAAITYLRRFCLSALVGVAPDDDNDGNESNYKARPKQEPVSVPQVTPSQVAEIRSMLASCDNAYIAKIMDWLGTYKITNLETMPVTFYSTIKTRVQAHLDVPQTAIVGDA